ncbi:hypothetical protein [Nodosilinea sp. LEGE 07088]|uniref:hypothetical protein n=1 Tax=Nodosilinea sp. LEGE 07088 TaxID=2777968 RepID=UPI002413ECFD
MECGQPPVVCEGGYSAQALGESIFTQDEDLIALRAMVRDAVQCHFFQSKFFRKRDPWVLEEPRDLLYRVSSWFEQST